MGSPVPDLLAAVRRRLWLTGLLGALRLALWGSAAALLLAAAVHALLRPVMPQAMTWTLLVVWGACLARAAALRPTDQDCAVWADQQLQGENAFSTWLDLHCGRAAGADPRAVQWLDEWTAARSAHAASLLARHPWPGRLARPALTLALCAGLCTIVLTLVERPALRSAQTTPPHATSSTDAATSAMAQASTPALQQLASEFERALRSPSQDAASGRPPAGGGAASTEGKGVGPSASAAEEGPDRGARAQAKAVAPDAAGARAASGPSGEAIAAKSQGGPGTGRGAGQSVDEAGPSTTQRLPRGASTPARGIDVAAPTGPTPQRQADMAEGGTYDDSQGLARAAALTLPAALPAQAPAAAADVTMTATESNYVQAWMKAITRSGGR